jgi:N-acyl-D-aspartate/D-glutamate deacylase
VATVKQVQCDLLILNAEVFDGSNSNSVYQDVAVKDDKIIALGDLSNAKANVTVDATGLVLAPGFIDVHTHDDLELIRNPQMLSKMSQGVTSVIIGNCGISASPYTLLEVPPDPINLLGTKEEFKFSSLTDYIKTINEVKPSTNVVALVGHTTLRAHVMDSLDRAASIEEISKMKKMLRLALQQGAKGLSSGLAYHNANCAPAAETEALAAELNEFNALYTTHLRTEFDGIIDALDEAFTLGRNANVPVVISHLKCAGKENWGRSREVIAHIEKAQYDQPIACDCYPYNASSSTLDLTQVTDDFEIFITWSTNHSEMAGQTLVDIAQQWGLSLMDAAKRLQPAGAVYHGIDEADVRNIIKFPTSMIGSDGLPCDPHPHPRLWGTFPRVLGHYSRDNKLLPLRQAIHKMTGLSATEYCLEQRGFIKEGYFADLVLFDPKTIKDNATFVRPFKTSTGIKQVWVNGQLSYQEGIGTNENAEQRAGRFLSHR